MSERMRRARAENRSRVEPIWHVRHTVDPERLKYRGVIQVHKARWGWWVDGRWCPTVKIRDHEIKGVRERTGKIHVRTPA